jgi:hypothetical protein
MIGGSCVDFPERRRALNAQDLLIAPDAKGPHPHIRNPIERAEPLPSFGSRSHHNKNASHCIQAAACAAPMRLAAQLEAKRPSQNSTHASPTVLQHIG